MVPRTCAATGSAVFVLDKIKKKVRILLSSIFKYREEVSNMSQNNANKIRIRIVNIRNANFMLLFLSAASLPFQSVNSPLFLF